MCESQEVSGWIRVERPAHSMLCVSCSIASCNKPDLGRAINSNADLLGGCILEFGFGILVFGLGLGILGFGLSLPLSQGAGLLKLANREVHV